MMETERAYIAGFFDGEGSVSVQNHMARRPGLPTCVVTIAQRDPAPLLRIREELGYGNVCIATTTGTAYLQIAKGEDVLAFARLVYPYLRVKRKQIRLAYRIARLTIPRRRPVPIFIRERRIALADELYAANLAGRLKPVANRHGSSQYASAVS